MVSSRSVTCATCSNASPDIPSIGWRSSCPGGCNWPLRHKRFVLERERMSVTRKPTLRAVSTGAGIYQLRIDLRHLKPAIWRRVLVPGSIKLSKLHVVLLWAMGWHGGHLHGFVIGDTDYGVPDPDYPQV